MKIVERLAQYIEYKKISLNSFDISIGAGNGYIGKQIKNKASIGGDTIEKIASIYTDLSLDWLITGKGDMIKNQEKEEIKEMELVKKKLRKHDKLLKKMEMELNFFLQSVKSEALNEIKQ